MSRYEPLFQAELGTRLKYSLMFSRIMHRFPGHSFNIFSPSEKIIDKYLEVVDFSLSYKDYLLWSLLNFKLR